VSSAPDPEAEDLRILRGSMQRTRPALFVAMALFSLAPLARAQHPMPSAGRPLHVRIADADVVAVATIGTIDEGRIEVRDADVLRGTAPKRFEIKRSPAQPPPFVTGVPAVLLLRGARPPYVLVDEPREVIVPSDAVTAQRWSEALRALFDAGDDPEKLLHTYLIWLDGDDETLREAAGAAFADPRAPFLPLGAEDAVERARAAIDPRRATANRRISALLAATHPAGADALLAGVPGPAEDPQVVATALRATPTAPRESREAALLRALANDEPEVRRAALLSAPLLWNDAVAAKVAEIAKSDPDAGVRAEANDATSRGGMK
jgi:hypothetical protein